MVATLAPANAPIGHSLVFVDDMRGVDTASLEACVAVLCRKDQADQLPAGPIALIVPHPKHALQDLALALFPGSIGDAAVLVDPNGVSSNPNGAIVAPTARLEDDVVIEPGAIVGDDVEIGAGTVIGANAVIARGCRIGRDCRIGPQASIQYALIGDRARIMPGALIGQDGFGYTPRPDGLRKVPQLGRVIIQDDVEIGAGTAVDRGTLGDTVIGQGTKIDNLCQIAHNVRIGMHTVIAGQCGISGSVTIGSQCMLGGGVGIADQIAIGDAVQLAGGSGVMSDIPAGERWGGSPAQPIKQAMRELAALRRLINDTKTAR